jgi:hypothetical protein
MSVLRAKKRDTIRRTMDMAHTKRSVPKATVPVLPSEERPVPEYILQYQSTWAKKYRIWNTIYYILAIGSALLAAVAAIGWKEKIQPVRASLFIICIASASFSSILTVLDPKTKAEAYRNANKVLGSAILKYHLDPAVGKQELSAALSIANDCLK